MHARPCQRAASSLTDRAACASVPIARDRRRSVSLRSSAPSVDLLVESQPHTSFEAARQGMFVDQNTSFVEEYRIRGYEVTPDQRATMVTIANLLQEAASNHCVGAWGRTDNGFASPPWMKDSVFVMTRLQVRMFQYPRWGDIVQVKSYFMEEGKITARRDWVIVDKASGATLGLATSTWLAINMVTRRIAKLPDDVRATFNQFTAPQSRNSIPPEESKLKLPELDAAPQVEGPKQVARRSDMDMNGHINNVSYIAWVLESVPEEVYSKGLLQEIEIDFKAECQAGNTVEILCSELGPARAASGNGNTAAASKQFLHTVRRCDEKTNCQELVRARTTWK